MRFTFNNEYTPDFAIRYTECNFDTPNGTISNRTTGTYTQTEMLQDAVRIYVNVYPTNMSQTEGLEFSYSQEGLSIQVVEQSNYKQVRITDFDTTKPLAVHLGNVLLAYMYV